MKFFLIDFNVSDENISFSSTIVSSIIDAENELLTLEEELSETFETIKKLKPECDKAVRQMSIYRSYKWRK